MECPYCTESLKFEATVCKSCSRDLTLVRPLLSEVHELSLELDKLQRRSQQLDAQIARRERPIATYGSYLVFQVIVPVLLLIAAHALIIIFLDLSPLYLRIASIVIPLPFGVAAVALSKMEWRSVSAIALFVGVVSVGLMLTIVGIVDKVPIIPESWRDWREFAEYAMSVALAYLTGALIAGAVPRMISSAIHDDNRPNAFAIRSAAFLGGNVSKASVHRRARRIQELIQTAGPLGGVVATAAGSAFTGLKSVLGS